MGEISTTDARTQFAELINRAAFGKERVVLTRRGKGIVALAPVEDVKLLEALEDRIDLDEARVALSETKKKGTVSWEKIKNELELWLPYRVEFTPRAEKQFKAFDWSVQMRLARRIDSLAKNPHPQGSKKLTAEEDFYRLRTGDYRVIDQV